MAHNDSTIIKASIWATPTNSGPNLEGYWGVLVTVENHGDYLIHNSPSSGTVATAASNMSSLWSKVRDIPVATNDKTIRGCMKASHGAATNYVSSALTRYLMGVTCVGTAAKIGAYLISK